jgi:hypothetical protein
LSSPKNGTVGEFEALRLKQEFYQLTFQMEVGKRKQGGGNPQKYALLSEAQATFIATL